MKFENVYGIHNDHKFDLQYEHIKKQETTQANTFSIPSSWAMQTEATKIASAMS